MWARGGADAFDVILTDLHMPCKVRQLFCSSLCSFGAGAKIHPTVVVFPGQERDEVDVQTESHPALQSSVCSTDIISNDSNGDRSGLAGRQCIDSISATKGLYVIITNNAFIKPYAMNMTRH